MGDYPNPIVLLAAFPAFAGRQVALGLPRLVLFVNYFQQRHSWLRPHLRGRNPGGWVLMPTVYLAAPSAN